MDKHTWLWWRRNDLETEWEQANDEGRSVEHLTDEVNELRGIDDNDQEFQTRFNDLLDVVQRLPLPDNEPSDLEAIRRARPPKRHELGPVIEDLEDRLYGAWLGRCAGCLLGKPIEGWKSDRLWPLLRSSGAAMLSDYLWRMDISPDEFTRHEAESVLRFGETIHHMPEDDDTNYTTTALALLETYSPDFAQDDVATFWLRNMPILHTCTAERVAYRNFVAGVWPPESARHRNPYREWIGAQIRGDLFGYVCPGDPARAAELACRDASISHVANGIYGEMWVAAMHAAAAVTDDMVRVIEIGLGEIPKQSRLSAAVRDVLDWHANEVAYEDAVARIHERWNEWSAHHWCHTISNAQIVALGLLYGNGDFERTVTRAVYPCFDTDCNGATAGSIVGLMLGAEAMPEKWTGILNDTLHTGVAGYHVVKISEMAKLTSVHAARSMAKQTN